MVWGLDAAFQTVVESRGHFYAIGIFQHVKLLQTRQSQQQLVKSGHSCDGDQVKDVYSVLSDFKAVSLSPPEKTLENIASPSRILTSMNAPFKTYPI